MIQRLLITHFRVLSHVDISQLSRCNLFIGQNGTGKTSLLEAIYLLSRGKSFRHHQPRHYVQHGQDTTTVFAELSFSKSVSDFQSQAASMAVAKLLDGTSKLKLNGAPVPAQSELTRQLPVVLLDPTELNLLDHGSAERRGLLDWLVFHTKPAFYKTWLAYSRALKQRNRLLKSYQGFGELSDAVRMQASAFDTQLVLLGEQIHALRQEVISQWQPIFTDVCAEFLPQYTGISMRYSAGFDAELGLAKILSERLASDIELGYTRVGAHRADLTLYVDVKTDKNSVKKHAADMLSRGEKKLLIMALKLSQLQLLSALGVQSMVLLDDINAELDAAAITRLLAGLKACHSQLFITSLSTDMRGLTCQLWKDQATIYQVDNGSIAPM